MSREQDDRQTAIEFGHQHRTKPVPLNEPDYEALIRRAWAPRPRALRRNRSTWRRLVDFILGRS